MGKLTEWLKETNELIEDWEAESQSLQEKCDLLTNQLMNLQNRIQAAHELVGAYMRKHPVESATPDNLQLGSLTNKTYPDMLVEIAKQSNGILNVADAVKLLYRANIGTSEKQIQHSVYNVLSRWKNHFTKIDRGQYRFTNHIDQKATTQRVIKTKPLRDRNPSGVRNAVRDLKLANPQWTSKDVLNHLLKSGFDFKGKKPAQSVGMAWTALGYSKENKQLSYQALTFEPFVSVTRKTTED